MTRIKSSTTEVYDCNNLSGSRLQLCHDFPSLCRSSDDHPALPVSVSKMATVQSYFHFFRVLQARK